MTRHRTFQRCSWLLQGLVLATAAACVSEPVPEPAPPPGPETTVYFYPSQGQSPEQQDRDKYECNAWAVKQSGFDPSLPTTPPHLRTVMVSGGPPPGAGIATGAVLGAVLGAVIASPHDSGAGAIVGGITGAAVGGAAEASSEEARQRAAASSAADARAAQLERQASSFRRAMSACLEGRGYNVR